MTFDVDDLRRSLRAALQPLPHPRFSGTRTGSLGSDVVEETGARPGHLLALRGLGRQPGEFDSRTTTVSYQRIAAVLDGEIGRWT